MTATDEPRKMKVARPIGPILAGWLLALVVAGSGVGILAYQFYGLGGALIAAGAVIAAATISVAINTEIRESFAPTRIVYLPKEDEPK